MTSPFNRSTAQPAQPSIPPCEPSLARLALEISIQLSAEGSAARTGERARNDKAMVQRAVFIVGDPEVGSELGRDRIDAAASVRRVPRF